MPPRSPDMSEDLRSDSLDSVYTPSSFEDSSMSRRGFNLGEAHYRTSQRVEHLSDSYSNALSSEPGQTHVNHASRENEHRTVSTPEPPTTLPLPHVRRGSDTALPSIDVYHQEQENCRRQSQNDLKVAEAVAGSLRQHESFASPVSSESNAICSTPHRQAARERLADKVFGEPSPPSAETRNGGKGWNATTANLFTLISGDPSTQFSSLTAAEGSLPLDTAPDRFEARSPKLATFEEVKNNMREQKKRAHDERSSNLDESLVSSVRGDDVERPNEQLSSEPCYDECSESCHDIDTAPAPLLEPALNTDSSSSMKRSRTSEDFKPENMAPEVKEMLQAMWIAEGQPGPHKEPTSPHRTPSVDAIADFVEIVGGEVGFAQAAWYLRKCDADMDAALIMYHNRYKNSRFEKTQYDKIYRVDRSENMDPAEECCHGCEQGCHDCSPPEETCQDMDEDKSLSIFWCSACDKYLHSTSSGDHLDCDTCGSPAERRTSEGANVSDCGDESETDSRTIAGTVFECRHCGTMSNAEAGFAKGCPDCKNAAANQSDATATVDDTEDSSATHNSVDGRDNDDLPASGTSQVDSETEAKTRPTVIDDLTAPVSYASYIDALSFLGLDEHAALIWGNLEHVMKIGNHPGDRYDLNLAHLAALQYQIEHGWELPPITIEEKNLDKMSDFVDAHPAVTMTAILKGMGNPRNGGKGLFKDVEFENFKIKFYRELEKSRAKEVPADAKPVHADPPSRDYVPLPSEDEMGNGEASKATGDIDNNFGFGDSGSPTANDKGKVGAALQDSAMDAESHSHFAQVQTGHDRPGNPDTASTSYNVTYWITVESGDKSIHVPIEKKHVSGPEKSIIEGSLSMKKVWQWVQEKGLGDKVGLQDAFDLAKDMHGSMHNASRPFAEPRPQSPSAASLYSCWGPPDTRYASRGWGDN